MCSHGKLTTLETPRTNCQVVGHDLIPSIMTALAMQNPQKVLTTVSDSPRR